MKYTITQGELAICVDAAGAQLTSVTWKGREYLWQGDSAYWPDQSLLLFPYVGRFTDGKYTFRGKTYPMDIHGFAKDSMFEIENAGEHCVTFVLRDSEDTRAVYPFRFQLSVTYEVRDNTVFVSYDVENLSGEMMCFGIGGHPGFNVPLEEGLSFEDYYLEFSRPHTPDRVGHTEACFLSGNDTPFPLEDGIRLPLRHDLFDADVEQLVHKVILLRHHHMAVKRDIRLRAELADRVEAEGHARAEVPVQDVHMEHPDPCLLEQADLALQVTHIKTD